MAHIILERNVTSMRNIFFVTATVFYPTLFSTFRLDFLALRGDCMIPFCRDEISTRSAGTDFTLRLQWKINSRPGEAGQFST